MPPFSTELWQEGAQFKSFKLVKGGQFDEAGVTKMLSDDPAQYPGCSGTRTLSDVSSSLDPAADVQNISDLHAQIAACHRGVSLILALVKEQSIEIVDFYMHAIMHTAEQAVRDLLRQVSQNAGGKVLQAVDWLDNGTKLVLEIDINEADGSATFDFTGTSPQM
jgi:5-oxoprolinase (ATP-hydrolysing)